MKSPEQSPTTQCGVPESVESYWKDATRPRLSPLDRVVPRRGGGEELVKARQAVDHELAAMHLAMCSMRTRRNAFSPISILPPEILARIFTFHAINQPATRENLPYDIEDPLAPNWTLSQLGWITVTHVCHHWRQIALAHAGLWANISFSLGDDWAEEMLARSRSAPILFSRTFGEDSSLTRRMRSRAARSSRKETALLLAHIAHTQQLLLIGPSGLLGPLVKSLTFPAPFLETLDLKGSIFRDYAITIPSDLFAKHTPRLRHISLDGFRVPWNSPVFSNLTSLDVAVSGSRSDGNPTFSYEEVVDDDINDEATLEPTHEQLFAALERMPTLQHLALDRCLPPSAVPDSANRVISLPHLSKLELTGLSPEIISLIQHLNFPPSTALHLHCSPPPVPTTDNADFLSLLGIASAHIKTAEGPAYPMLALEFASTTYPAGLAVRVWDVAVQDAPSSPSGEAKLDMTVEWRRHPALADVIALMRSICEYLPLDSALRTLVMDEGRDDWRPDFWPYLFSQYTGVTAVRARGRAGLALSHALTTPLPTTGALFLPKLVSLGLHRTDFTATAPFYADEFHVALPSRLRARKVLKAGLKKVEIVNCSVKHEWVEEIHDIVPTVSWDHEMGELALDPYPDVGGWSD